MKILGFVSFLFFVEYRLECAVRNYGGLLNSDLSQSAIRSRSAAANREVVSPFFIPCTEEEGIGIARLALEADG